MGTTTGVPLTEKLLFSRTVVLLEIIFLQIYSLYVTLGSLKENELKYVPGFFLETVT